MAFSTVEIPMIAVAVAIFFFVLMLMQFAWGWVLIGLFTIMAGVLMLCAGMVMPGVVAILAGGIVTRVANDHEKIIFGYVRWRHRHLHGE